MITEKGTVKLTTKLDENLYKDMTEKTKKVSIAFIVIGALIIVLGFIISIFVKKLADNTDILGLLGLFVLLVGVIMINSRKNAVKHARQWARENEHEFFADRIEVRQSVNGEVVDTEKIYLPWVTAPKESAKLISFGCAKNDGAGRYYIRKEGVPESELNIIRSMLRLPLMPTTQVPPYTAPTEPLAENTQPNEEKTENEQTGEE